MDIEDSNGNQRDERNQEDRDGVRDMPNADRKNTPTLDSLSLFDFTEAEESIVNTLLEKGPQSVSSLGRIADIPRTTAYSVLKRLQERGMVRRQSRSYASVWNIVSSTKLKKRMASGLEYLDRELTVEQLEAELHVKVSETVEFFVFNGVDAMFHVYQWMMINHFNQRVCGIQPRASMETILAKLHPEKVAQLNDVVKDNKVIMDAVLPESIQEYYRTILLGQPRLAKSIEGRTAAVHLVPDAILPFNADLLVGRNTALLANWDEEALVLIKNASMVLLLRCLFEMLQHEGRSFDHNAFVRSLIEGNE